MDDTKSGFIKHCALCPVRKRGLPITSNKPSKPTQKPAKQQQTSKLALVDASPHKITSMEVDDWSSDWRLTHSYIILIPIYIIGDVGPFMGIWPAHNRRCAPGPLYAYL